VKANGVRNLLYDWSDVERTAKLPIHMGHGVLEISGQFLFFYVKAKGTCLHSSEVELLTTLAAKPYWDVYCIFGSHNKPEAIVDYNLETPRVIDSISLNWIKGLVQGWAVDAYTAVGRVVDFSMAKNQVGEDRLTIDNLKDLPGYIWSWQFLDPVIPGKCCMSDLDGIFIKNDQIYVLETKSGNGVLTVGQRYLQRSLVRSGIKIINILEDRDRTHILHADMDGITLPVSTKRDLGTFISRL